MREDISEAEIPALTEEIVKQGLWILHRYKSPTGCEQIYIQDPVFDDKQPIHGYKTTPSKIKALLLTSPKAGEGSPNSGEAPHQERVSATPEVGHNRTELNRTKKKKSSCPNFSEDSDQVRLSKLLLGKIRERKPDYQPKLNGKGIQRWARDMDFLIRIDKKEPTRIQEVIEWCQGDPFWRNNILSTEKLRKQFEQLELKMGRPAPDPYESLPRATKERAKRERERNEKKDGAVFRPVTDFDPEDSG
jgi:hypothetical protein